MDYKKYPELVIDFLRIFRKIYPVYYKKRQDGKFCSEKCYDFSFSVDSPLIQYINFMIDGEITIYFDINYGDYEARLHTHFDSFHYTYFSNTKDERIIRWKMIESSLSWLRDVINDKIIFYIAIKNGDIVSDGWRRAEYFNENADAKQLEDGYIKKYFTFSGPLIQI